MSTAKRPNTKPGYRAYCRWFDKEYVRVCENKSRFDFPLTIRKWRRATGDKRPA